MFLALNVEISLSGLDVYPKISFDRIAFRVISQRYKCNIYYNYMNGCILKNIVASMFCKSIT